MFIVIFGFVLVVFVVVVAAAAAAASFHSNSSSFPGSSRPTRPRNQSINHSDIVFLCSCCGALGSARLVFYFGISFENNLTIVIWKNTNPKS